MYKEWGTRSLTSHPGGMIGVLEREPEREAHMLPALDDLAAEARQLVRESLADPWGEISASLYETARIVALLPSALRPAESLPYVLSQQQPDGSWGGAVPMSYRLVPTLSATSMLLHLVQDVPEQFEREVLLRATRQAMSYLSTALRADISLPDTVAVELIVPQFLEDIHACLQELSAREPYTRDEGTLPLQIAAFVHQFPLPEATSSRPLQKARALLHLRQPLPVQLCHCLEVLAQDLPQNSVFPAYE